MSVGTEHERRVSQRLPARVVVTVEGSNQQLGKTLDLSLDGMWLATATALEMGAELALTIHVPGRSIQVSGKVVRLGSEGVGLAFIDMHAEDRKYLRRFVNEFTSVQGTRRTIDALLARDRDIRPITDPARIRSTLRSAAQQGATVHLLPEGRDFRESVVLTRLDGSGVKASSKTALHAQAGDRAFGLFTLNFVSYTFAVDVTAVTGKALVMTLPEALAYSERRETDRVPAAEGSTFSWSAPWLPSGRNRYSVVDTSPGGLSFRIDGHDCALVPGTTLPDVVFEQGGTSHALHHATVRNIIPKVDVTGAYLRIGVSHGVQRSEIQSANVDTRPKSWIGRMLQRASELVSYSVHSTVERTALRAPQGAPRKIRFKRGQSELVGLLDRTFESEERVRCPLVLVVPGFGGRKEQMSFFANILVQGFRYANEDIAVLRIDGSNNLGESEKDDACLENGKHTLHYTISGTVDDVHATLDWARRNELIDPSHIILMSFSMGSIAVRHVLATTEAADVGLWVNYMGASDVQDAVIHVSGQHLDVFAVEGSLGVCSLIGCLTDGDRFVQDFKDLGIGQIADARREIANVSADVVWLAGRYDAFMNIDRVRDLMSIQASGTRELIEVPSGHVPTSGGEAIRQFVEIAGRVWGHVHRSTMPAFTPSVGQLARLSEREWKRVRNDRLTNREEWWRRYLLGQGGLGFDVLELAEEYTELMETQARAVDSGGRDVLELGAGTGNLTRRLVADGPRRLVATELVPEVLERLRSKLAGAVGLETLQLDAEGSPRVAMRRWLQGDLPGLRFLAERVPGISRGDLALLQERWSDEVHAALRGYAIDVDALALEEAWSAPMRCLVADLGRLSRLARGEITVEEAVAALERLPPSAAQGPSGLPFPDDSFDVVVMSLVLSYIDHPDDLLWECRRVLRPGGRLILSSMVHDADSSKLYLDLVKRLQGLPEAEIPAGQSRESLLASTRAYAESAAELLRLEEEGHFRFYDGPELAAVMLRRGFRAPRISQSWGTPPQATLVECEAL
jgi:SAM-dependent methyltransferase